MLYVVCAIDSRCSLLNTVAMLASRGQILISDQVIRMAYVASHSCGADVDLQCAERFPNRDDEVNSNGSKLSTVFRRVGRIALC